MKHLIVLCIGLLILAGGCPSSDPTSAVTARIGISATQGSAPLPVTVSAVDSTSANGGTLRYAWDFAGLAAADTASATHTFTSPGLYTITLHVTDETGAVGVASVDVRVQGTATPVAVIHASTNSGPVPLVVQFDGSGSSAADDVIRDYSWNFGDGSATDPRTAPTHVYQQAGTYTVTLDVTTAGGVSGSTTTTINAGARNGSLQFDGSQVATLPLGSTQSLTGATVEAWFKASTAGGTVVSAGGTTLVIEIRPGDNVIRFQAGGVTKDASAFNLAGSWRHVALTYDATAGAALYLDGLLLTTTPGAGGLSVTTLTLGASFVGKIANVRFWSVARSAADIAANFDRRAVSGTGLLGDWRLDDGSGQSLINQVGVAGVRGTSTADESADAAWSTDGPTLK